ncbi:hypothetical protein PENSPDRAFT_690412 [Peniophora sp. CONT]|nr:hypothetical protein PENSPDRAFT_690412 [Peniophora sp. CONT]
MPVELAYPSKSEWSSSQREFARFLIEGPTAAIEHFRALWNARPPGLLSRDDSFVALASVLVEHFSDPQENMSDEYKSSGLSLNQLGESFWRATVETKLLLLLLDIMSDPDFLRHDLRLSCAIIPVYAYMVYIWLVEGFDRGEAIRRVLPITTYSELPLELIMPSDLAAEFWLRCEVVWRSLWASRNEFLGRGSVVLPIHVSRLSVLENAVLVTYKLLRDCRNLGLTGRGSYTELVNLSSFLWFLHMRAKGISGQIDDRDHDALMPIIDVHDSSQILEDETFEDYPSTGSSADELAEMIQAVGAEKIVPVFEQVLQNTSAFRSARRLRDVLTTFGLLLYTGEPSFLQAYWGSSMLKALSVALRHCFRDAKTKSRSQDDIFLDIDILVMAALHLQFVDKGLREGALTVHKVQVSDVWSIMEPRELQNDAPHGAHNGDHRTMVGWN